MSLWVTIVLEKNLMKTSKKMVVDLYNTGSSVKDLCSEYGVSDVSIYRWIKQYSPIDLEDGTSVTPDDVVKLQKEIRRLQEENDILKKAMAIFAKK